ncbi:MAG: anti-phage ZorAB system protein ZorA [Sterolibacterium sp.]|nr:anti-phage ZorAB system protein ZorA [Sterolibacterium sp.]
MLNYWYVWIVAALLMVITAGFVLRFVRPALRLRQEFIGVIKAIQETRATEAFQLRQQITDKVMANTSFAKIWAEYAQTLHPQKQAGLGETRWRATALAETFFTDQALVDTPLKTEYYKHLPGIMTGLGIIGTFTGLIIGLGNFDISIEPGQAQAQLRTLINAVGHAFIVSAIAITLAMIFTWVEKSMVTVCYRLTEHLRQEIDGLFDVGADVEYLERLVAAAESSAKEVLFLKDTLAEQIIQALREQTRQQIEASERSSQRISTDLGRLLAAGLSQPIADIASAVHVFGERQDETVTRMVTEVVNGFGNQMENLFAGQMRDLHEVLSSTNTSLRAMAEQFSLMAGHMNAAGKEAVEAMSSRIEAVVAMTEERQLAMHQQAGNHAEHLHALVARSQADSAEMVQQLLARLGNEVAAVIGSLQEQSKLAVGSQQAQVERLTRVAEETVGGMGGQVERLAAISIATSHKLQEAIEALACTTGESIRGMNAGAEKLGVAAGSFADAGKQVAMTVADSSKVAADIRLAADAMRDSAKLAQLMLGDYGDAHEAFARLVADLKATIERAKREANLSAELTDRLESAAGRLGIAQQQADNYLEGVSKVLAHAHQVFADSVEQTLRVANRQFQGELSQAVGLLSGAIADLGDSVENLSEQRRP